MNSTVQKPIAGTFTVLVGDAADDFLLNEVIWRSVRGPDNPMPSPVRAGFVLGHVKEGDDD